ncbi:hypothetical protein JZ751_012058 [Albula glossodonta]|uniref:t-SNARE coiled-coil homology domain-containing protein n=1 Tax=Albula glossodonta TaxID=121402 RepID=A0A8T2PRG3_9TELE|nr:hypothetical protein JZ751_012058 [Albula glossodonta]
MRDRLADLTVVDATRGLVDKISSQVEEVKNKHIHILTAPDPDEITKDELTQLNDKIKKNADAVRDSLKAMQEGLPQDENMIGASVNLRIQKSQHSVLSHAFAEVMTQYNEAQEFFRERSKIRIQRQLEITGRVTTSEQLEAMLESGIPAIFTSDVISDSQITREALNEIKARHRDIIQLESSIRELHQIFMDMAMLVESQGEMINNIEKNVSSAKEYVCRASLETKKAVKYQTKSRRVRLIPSMPNFFKSSEPPSGRGTQP